MGDQGINLQPPKRSQRKTKKKKRVPTSSEDDDGSDLVKEYTKPKRKPAQKKKGKGKKVSLNINNDSDYILSSSFVFLFGHKSCLHYVRKKSLLKNTCLIFFFFFFFFFFFIFSSYFDSFISTLSVFHVQLLSQILSVIGKMFRNFKLFKNLLF